ncbi:Maf family protein [Anaerovorax odorimutans]|uniref:Maf family protein n=1 Tax=Anaerovorax odorimutans TaxID=109327 RepID=UPI000403271A|nr:Maf family protein [Anaerovorax odorimutans]
MEEKIILASSSPRRIEIMKNHGIDPIVMPSDIDETIPKNLNMQQAVMYLALKKALNVEEKYLKENPSLKNKTIISADTIVFKDQIIGKPSDYNDAVRILETLNGTNHYVATGVCILKTNTPIRQIFYEVTEVIFKNYTHDDIKNYIDSGEPWDKAGGYAIQGKWKKYIDHYIGDYENVVGFPWKRIQEELRALNY